MGFKEDMEEAIGIKKELNSRYDEYLLSTQPLRDRIKELTDGYDDKIMKILEEIYPPKEGYDIECDYRFLEGYIRFYIDENSYGETYYITEYDIPFEDYEKVTIENIGDYRE